MWARLTPHRSLTYRLPRPKNRDQIPHALQCLFRAEMATRKVQDGGYADETRVVTSLGSINDFGRMGKKWLSPKQHIRNNIGISDRSHEFFFSK